MKTERLLAKSYDEKSDEWMESYSLPGHLKDVWNAANAVLDATQDDQLTALGLDPTVYRERFRRIVLLAAACHDLGKANDHFQGMLRKTRDVPQGLRHEWVSILLLLNESIRKWLNPLFAENPSDYDLVLWAIAGHHRKPLPQSPSRSGEGEDMTVFISHKDFHESLTEIKNAFGGLVDPPSFTANQVLPLVGGKSVFRQLNDWIDGSREIFDEFPDEEKAFVAAVKVALIGCDVAGSALPHTAEGHDRWISLAFSQTPQDGDLAGIVKQRLGSHRVRPFQQEVADSKAEVTFVRAGCGSGKTLAAYHWAATNHPNRRLYFCYPTTGTATEGFRDYLINPEGGHAGKLFHGRAEADLARLLVTPEREEQPSQNFGPSPEDEAAADELTRIESLDAWSTPIVSCTVDTVLGLFQNNRRGVYAWPALAGAAYVFDEIHSMDSDLFGTLLKFLQTMRGVPVLLMTASLPKSRRVALDEVLKDANRSAVIEIGGPDNLETQHRYHREETPESIAQRVKAEFNSGGKVLWVSNTVKRVMETAETISDFNPKIYHSRFKYEHRVDRHGEVVDAFKPEYKTPVVACSSQVSEMSLDLKGTTLLITELAPVPALIQRLGRLNRDAKPGDPTRPFIVVEVESELPYGKEELEAARRWLASLPSGPLSQRDLAEAWEAHDLAEACSISGSAWLEGGPITEIGQLRKPAFGITVIMREDVDRVKCRDTRLVSVALPMPETSDWRKWERFKGLPIAERGTITYHPLTGAKWNA